MTDWCVVARYLSEWWARDADPDELVPILLDEEWDGTPEHLVRAAIAAECKTYGER